MATATLIRDPKIAGEERIGLRGGLLFGERHYIIDSSNQDTALSTLLAEVARGSAWNGTYTTLKAGDYDPVRRFGSNWIYRIGYIEDGGSSGSIDRTATNTTAFHEIVESMAQQEITANLTFDAIKPTSIQVASDQIVVTGYRTGAQYLTSWTHWRSIRGKLNSGTVAIPGILNVSGSGFNVAAKELLALTRRVQVVQQNLLRVDYTFAIGPAGTFQYVWVEEDEDGNPYITHTDDVIDTATYTAGNLWG